MFVSSFKVSNETMEKNEMKPRERSRRWWEKIKELEESDRLKDIRNRQELVSAISGMERNMPCYNFLAHLITGKYIKETLVGRDEDQRRIYEYSLTSRKPQCDPAHRRRKPKAKTIDFSPAPLAAPTPVTKVSKPMKEITIIKGDVTISVSVEADEVKEFIQEFLK